MIIEFTEEEFNFIGETGKKRHMEMRGVSNIADYDPNRKTLTELQLDRLGLMAEAAVAKWFGYDITNTPLDIWPSFVKRSELKNYNNGDVYHNGIKYEVRRADRLGNPVPIREKDIEIGATIIQVYIDYKRCSDGRISVPREAMIVGYCNTTSDYEEGWKPRWGKDPVTRVNDPRPIEELFPEAVKA